MPKDFRRHARVAVIAIAALMTISIAGAQTSAAQTVPASCFTPIKLRIGALDPRFGLSQADLQTALQQASDLWNAAAHRPLFVYDPSAEIAVNLVYDERQEKALRFVQAQQSISDITQKATRIANDLKPLQTVLEDEERSYSSQIASFERVREIQALSGAGKALSDRMAALQQQKQELDRLNAEINARIEKYNALIETSNAELKALSDSGITGIELIAGHYAEEDGTKRIDVFEFKDRTDLVLVLTHELGHALGIDHSRNPQSIMAPLIVTKTLALSPADVAPLKTACPARR